MLFPWACYFNYPWSLIRFYIFCSVWGFFLYLLFCPYVAFFPHPHHHIFCIVFGGRFIFISALSIWSFLSATKIVYLAFVFLFSIFKLYAVTTYMAFCMYEISCEAQEPRFHNRQLLLLLFYWYFILFLCRRQVLWISKQILQLIMEDAIDDWIVRQIHWLRREDIIAQGIRWVQDVSIRTSKDFSKLCSIQIQWKVEFPLP